MPGQNPKVDEFLKKAKNWQPELQKLRHILLELGLQEEWKWNKPCYTFNNENVVILAGLKNHCWLAFMKGALLSDPHEILEAPGENSRAGRVIKFTSLGQIGSMEGKIRATIHEAIEVAKSGLKIDFKSADNLELPRELDDIFAKNPAFKDAFEALTPGRQRGYVLHFVGAKQSATRTSRIEKSMQRIFAGKGLQDR